MPVLDGVRTKSAGDMAGRLYNGLVELVAVVGMDEDTGLKPATYQVSQGLLCLLAVIFGFH